MFRMLCACLALGFVGVLVERSAAADDGRGDQPSTLHYTATLHEATSNGGSQPVRDFEVRCLVLPQVPGFPAVLYLMDESRDEQPWHAQFGRVDFDAEGRAAPSLPVQRHLHDGHSSWIDLWLGHYPAFAKLVAGAEWQEGDLNYRLLEEKTVNSQLCWLLEINAPQGRRTTLSIQKSNGTIQAAQHRYFVGMGERFDLNLKLEENTPAEEAVVETWTQAIAPLLKLKQALRFDFEREESLSPDQLQLAKEALDDVDKAADGTPFAALAGVIRREVTAGQQRETAMADLATRFVGRPAPRISVTPLEGGAAIDLSPPERVTVLHFWEYQEKPLAEPYGQIGYLDFLAQKRKGQVQVIGVISDKQIEKTGTASAALRSARKLREFMNIGYPLGHETEGALAALGDPRTFGVELPLWVVIGLDGTILHYRVGFYEVDNNQGLVELDAVIEQELRSK